MATARTVIKRALRLIGAFGEGQEFSASDAQDALESLQAMCDFWSSADYLSTDIVSETFTLTAGQSEYTMKTGGDFNTARAMTILAAQVVESTNNVRILREMPYTQIKGVNTPETASVPEYFSYLPNTTEGIFSVYPSPSSNYSVQIQSRKSAATFPDLDTDVALAPGVLAALAPNLAAWIAPEYQLPVSAELVRQAEVSFKAIQSRNSQKMDTLSTLDGIPGDRQGGYFNFYTGTFI